MVTSRERALTAVGRFCWSELCASDWMDAFWWVTDNPVQSFNICGEKNMLLSSVGAFYRFYCGNVRMDGHGRFLFALRFFCLRFFFLFIAASTQWYMYSFVCCGSRSYILSGSIFSCCLNAFLYIIWLHFFVVAQNWSLFSWVNQFFQPCVPYFTELAQLKSKM